MAPLGFQVKIETFFKVSFVPKPLYQIDACRADYQTRDQEFWNEMPPNGSMQIICRATGQCIFFTASIC